MTLLLCKKKKKTFFCITLWWCHQIYCVQLYMCKWVNERCELVSVIACLPLSWCQCGGTSPTPVTRSKRVHSSAQNNHFSTAKEAQGLSPISRVIACRSRVSTVQVFYLCLCTLSRWGRSDEVISLIVWRLAHLRSSPSAHCHWHQFNTEL